MMTTMATMPRTATLCHCVLATTRQMSAPSGWRAPAQTNDPGGSLRLEALMFVDGGNLTEAAEKPQQDWIAAQLARLAKQSCPAGK
jgi:hypothetical protein